MDPLLMLNAPHLLSRQRNSCKDPPFILVYVDANCLIWDFFLVVCRSRKRYALYLILLPKFHPIITTLILLILRFTHKNIFPAQSDMLLQKEKKKKPKKPSFFMVSLVLYALTSLQAEREDRWIGHVCRSAVSLSLLLSLYRGQSSPSPSSTPYFISSTFVPFPVLCLLVSPL